ncbi:cell division protein FtsQ, partial [Pseudomonas sp. CCI3.1]|nr:cell division protein FtsQ [Pseudomonas sp. CCI3.1]
TCVEGLNKPGVSAVYLAPVLQSVFSDAYLRTDTHWSEAGSWAAAKAIALQVQAMGISATPHTAYELSLIHISEPTRLK